MVYRSTCSPQRDAVHAFRFQPRPGGRKRDNDKSHTAVRYAMSSCTSEARGSRWSFGTAPDVCHVRHTPGGCRRMPPFGVEINAFGAFYFVFYFRLPHLSSMHIAACEPTPAGYSSRAIAGENRRRPSTTAVKTPHACSISRSCAWRSRHSDLLMYPAKSTQRTLYPHSLSYHAMTLTI
jgi:hypothetical protein